MMENRAKMGLPLIEESDGAALKNKSTLGDSKKMAMAGRASKFIQQDDLSMLKESSDEHSHSSKSNSDTESFDLL